MMYLLWMLSLALAFTDLPKLQKMDVSYGTLSPMFDKNTQLYTLAVPCCPAGWDYHLLPLDIRVEAEDTGTQIRIIAGKEEETQARSINMILGESSGFQDWNFQGMEIEVDVTLNGKKNTYKITVAPTITDALLIQQKCLWCPAPKNHPRPYRCDIPHATLVGCSCSCDPGYDVVGPSGRLVLNETTRIFTGACEKKISCPIQHATMVDDDCTCDHGYMGTLSLNPSTHTFQGTCVKIPPPKPTPPPRPPRGRWPCEGVTPYTCDDCPTCDEAGRIVMDLEKSCNIPQTMGLGGQTYEPGSGYMPHLSPFGSAYKHRDGRGDRIIYHTRWSRVSKLNPALHRHLCISPICRWRVEMAFNALANCQTLESPHANDVIHWRNYTDFTMHTLKHIVLVMEAAKADCRKVTAPTNVFTGAEISQTFRVHGIDITTDSTLRAAELAFRQAFSNLMDFPMRKLNVRIEGEPHPECPLAFDAPVCKHVDCGYGQCIPAGDGTSNYICLCNQCYEPGMVGGKKTCVRKRDCKIIDPCDPNPCACHSQCNPCPECQGPRKFQCMCQPNFSGPRCNKLDCPPGFDIQAGVGSDSHCGVCVPRAGTNVCAVNPCEHGGICSVDDTDQHGFRCQCSPAYSGRICERMNCPSGFVLENNVCVDRTKTVRVEVHDPCTPDPCRNGGFCIAQGTAYSCACRTGYSGLHCETETNACVPNPCRPDYTCHQDDKTAVGYRCTCPTCEKHLYNSAGEREPSNEQEQTYRRRLDEPHPDHINTWWFYDWEHAESISKTLPLPNPFPDNFNPLHHRSQHCTVYQHSEEMGAELTLTVKCPVDSGKAYCDNLMKKLQEFHHGGQSQLIPLERRVQWNCIAAKVTGVTEPHEELQIGNCPSHREFNFRWHYAYQECNFQSLGMGEDAIWQLYITQDGVETADPKYQELFCSNPICRGLILDLASLYVECPNSSPGVVGYCARKTKALRNSVKSCSNPVGVLVLRQQLQVQGVIDPLSNTEILAVEAYVYKQVLERTGAPADRTFVHAQPVLHINDWQSRRYPTMNSIYPEEVISQKGFAPDTLHAPGPNEKPRATNCQGLCLVTLQPGQTDEGIDPMSAIFATFNEPVRISECINQGSCKITLTPSNTARGHYTLNNDEFSPRAELVASAETLGLFPRLTLKPFTNYTCHLDAGVVTSTKSGQMSRAHTFWFMTGKPRDSLIKISISIGCDSRLQYDAYASYLPDYHLSTNEELIEPIRDVVRKVRNDPDNEFFHTDRRRLEVINRAVTSVDRERRLRRLTLDEKPKGQGAVSTPEVREVIECTTLWSWYIFSWLILIPIALCIIAVFCAARGFEPWIQDILREGIGTNTSYTRMTDSGYRSKSVENRDSLSYMLGGPIVYSIVLCVLGLLLSAGFGAFWAWVLWGNTDDSVYYIGALFAAAMCAMVWAVWVAIIATWTNPGQLPFFRDHKMMTKMKWSENEPRSKLGPPSFLDIDYATQGYTSTMVESDTKPEKVTVTVFRDVVQDGARAPSRMTIPLSFSQRAARCAFYLATLVFFAVLFLFTALAMHLCPTPAIINFIFFCVLSGIFYALLGILTWWLLARKHCWHAAVSVNYKPVREIKRIGKPSVVYEDAKEFLAKDIVFEEGTRFVKKLVVSPDSPARAEHVKPGMELVQIKAIVPIGMGAPMVEFVGTSGEQGDARRLLNNFEDRFRYSTSQGMGTSSAPRNVDVVLTFKHPKVQFSTPVY